MSLIGNGAEQIELVVRGPEGATTVRLCERSRVDGHETVFAVEAVADGMRARVDAVTVTPWDRLGEFFDGLAHDFRGWEGERVWRNNDLVVGATRLRRLRLPVLAPSRRRPHRRRVDVHGDHRARGR